MKKSPLEKVKLYLKPISFMYAAVFSFLLVLLLRILESADTEKIIAEIPLFDNSRLYIFIAAFILLHVLFSSLLILEQRLNEKSIFHRIIHSPLTAVILIVFAFRLWYYPQLQQYMTFYDTVSYTDYPYNIFQGQIDIFRTPVYPYFIKLIGLFSSEANLYINIVAVQKVISFIAIIIFYKALEKIVRNKYIAAAATVMFGCSPSVISWDVCILTETLAVASTILLLYLMVSYLKKPSIAKAIIIGIYSLYMVMLRPTFIYLFAILSVFYLFRFIFFKLDRRQCAAGVLALVFSGGILLGYSALNYKQNGYFGISYVGTNTNQLYIVIDEGYYDNPDYPELSQFIKTQIATTRKNSYEITFQMNEECDQTEVKNYVKSCFKQHSEEYREYTINKFAGLLPEALAVQYENMLQNPAEFQTINNVLLHAAYPFTFMGIWLAVGFALALVVIVAIKKKRCVYPALGLAALLFSHEFISIYGSMAEYQRLSIMAAPMFIMLLAYFADIALSSADRSHLAERILLDTLPDTIDKTE